MLILHGDNLVLSRKKLDEIVSSFKGEVIRLEATQIDFTKLKQATESRSLFGEDRLVVIESLFSRPPSKEKETIIRYLKESQPKSLVLWEGKAIDGRTLASFAKAKTEKFDLTRYIFRFLDSLAPNNQKNSLTLLHQCFNQDSIEMVFYMLARQIRLLIIARDLGKKGLTKMAPWQQNKLLSQAQKFELEKLLWLHRKLLEIDWQQKTGRASVPLSSQLDLLIASL